MESWPNQKWPWVVRVILYEGKVIGQLTIQQTLICPMTFVYWTTHDSLHLYEIGQLTVSHCQLSFLIDLLILLEKYLQN